MKQAIKPSHYQGLREMRTLKRELEAKKRDKDPDELAISEMRATRGWELMNKFINNLKLELNETVKGLMELGESYETIGQKTVVKELAVEVLNRIQQKVEDAAEAIEQSE